MQVKIAMGEGGTVSSEAPAILYLGVPKPAPGKQEAPVEGHCGFRSLSQLATAV